MESETELTTKVEYKSRSYFIKTDQGIDLSLKNNFDNKNPIFFKAKQSSLNPVQIGGFKGDIKQGGSCNVGIASIDIHCTGTHTECISHVSESETKIVDVCPRSFIPSQLISLKPDHISNTSDSYHAKIASDLVISKKMLVSKIKDQISSLIIRTLPNTSLKKNRNYDLEIAPFFTSDAIKYLSKLSVQHLLVDLPSIDKADDGGILGNHHEFFKKGKTISELLYIPNSVEDSFGFLQIQIPNWNLDAAPSRPIFYPV